MDLIKEQLDKEKLDEMQAVVRTITGYMVLPLYVMFWITDLFYAPEYKWEFLALRLFSIPLALLSNYFVSKATTLLTAERIGLAYIFGLSAIIYVMIYMMGDPTSPYYTGLIIIATGGLGFFPWTRKYFVYVVIVIFLPYLLIVLSLSPNEDDIPSLVIIGFFINGSVTVLWVIHFFREKLRLKEISTRLNLNIEIEKRKAVEADLIQARDEAVKASHAKSSFLANMSHELRTPLNAIIGYGGLLEDEVRENNHEEYLEDLNKINVAGNHLLNLITGVLDISKIEAGKMETFFEKIDLLKMIATEKSIFELNAEKNKNIFTINCPNNIGLLESDEVKLRQILYNLVSNAGKFTEHGRINLDVAPFSIKEQDWLRFDLSDSGIGMTKEQTAKVFEEFVQADSTTTKKYGGTGLGLSICRHFTRLLGGDIFIDSKEGYGTTFTVLIPRYPALYDEKISYDDLKVIAEKNSS